ncbi:MAG: hypothetical protein K5871_02350 [Lachnospiraceae bacterium]|nr:hypothetical protein [Lachnospiraceae bacterium]
MNKRKAFFLSMSVLDMVFRVAMWVIIIYLVVKGATRCYDLGYRVFTEEPIALEGYGRDVTVEVPVDFNAKELGDLFVSEGLSRDPYLFALQYYASEYREGVKGGTYVFNTEQTAEDMFRQMSEATAARELEEEQRQEMLLESAEQAAESLDALEGTDPDAAGEDTAENP